MAIELGDWNEKSFTEMQDSLRGCIRELTAAPVESQKSAPTSTKDVSPQPAVPASPKPELPPNPTLPQQPSQKSATSPGPANPQAGQLRVEPEGATGGQTGVVLGDVDAMISYKWTTKTLVKKFNGRLKGDGVRTWLDDEQIEGGILYEVLSEAIRKAAIVIICYSSEYLRARTAAGRRTSRPSRTRRFCS